MMLMRKAIEEFLTHLAEHEYSGKTVDCYRSALFNFNSYLEKRFNIKIYVEDISSEVFKDFLRQKREDGCAPTSRNHYLFTFRSFCDYLSDEKLLEENPVKNLKPVKTRKKEREYLTREQVETLVQETDHDIISTAVLVAYYTGLRPSELLGLKLEDVDLERGVIRVRGGKGNKNRKVPISGKLKEIIGNYLENVRPEVKTDNFIATAQSGGMSHHYFNQKLKQAARSAGWDFAEKVTPHVLRHSCASRLVKKNISLEKIRKLLGHSSIDVTSVYCHTRTEELSEAVDEL